MTDVRDAASQRDAGIHRVKRTTRWLTTGAVALTGLFAGLAAQATHSSASHAASGGSQATPNGVSAATAQQDPSVGTDAASGYGEGESEGDDGYGEQAPAQSAPAAPAQAPQYSAPSTPPQASSGAS